MVKKDVFITSLRPKTSSQTGKKHVIFTSFYVVSYVFTFHIVLLAFSRRNAVFDRYSTEVNSSTMRESRIVRGWRPPKIRSQTGAEADPGQWDWDFRKVTLKYLTKGLIHVPNIFDSLKYFEISTKMRTGLTEYVLLCFVFLFLRRSIFSHYFLYIFLHG